MDRLFWNILRGQSSPYPAPALAGSDPAPHISKPLVDMLHSPKRTGESSLFPDSMADREFPLQSLFLPAGGPCGSISKLPTIRSSFNSAAREAFALSLDKVDPRIRAKLDQPFGKDNLNQCFYAEPRLRHVLLPLWKSGFLYSCDFDWANLSRAYPPCAVLLALLAEFGDVDFNPLKGFPLNWESENKVNLDRVSMATAALLFFNGCVADTVRWIGGPHVAAHRNHPVTLRHLRTAGLPTPLVDEMERIFVSGIPRRCNASSTEANFQAYLAYGNHATVDEAPAKTYAALVKDNKKGYTILFDKRLTQFLLHCHVTPQGIVDLHTIHKNPRPIFDSSFRPFPWCMAINDWTTKDTEPTLTFATAELMFMIWVYNLRVTYPTQEINLADDDVSGAFRQAKYAPALVALHTSIQCGFGVLNTGATFGDNTSPSNFEPIALSRRLLASWLWLNDPDVELRTLPVLPPISFAAEPTVEEVASFTPADGDALNPGVLDNNGNRKPPTYPMHVDDNLYADIQEFLPRTVAASAASLFDILGWPGNPCVPTPLSDDKLVTAYNHTRRLVGRHFDSRRLTVGMLPYKRDQLTQLLSSWLSRKTFDLLELSSLLGLLDNHTKYARWARCWYYFLQASMRRGLIARYHVLRRLQAKHTGKRQRLEAALPVSLSFRLESLIARDKAAFLWSARCRFTLGPDALSALSTLHAYVVNTRVLWEVPLGLIIPRNPHFHTTGDASLTGGGACCHELEFWFDIPWTPKIVHSVRNLRSTAPGFIHINDLEFLILVLTLVAIRVRLDDLPPPLVAKVFPTGRPHIPVWLGSTDNMVSKSWETKGCATSTRAQGLISVYSELLRTTLIHTTCEHIKGVDNIIADDISRNDFSLSLSSRSSKLFAKHPCLHTYSYFHPSPELLQLLISKLFSGPSPVPCVLPNNLGLFAPVVSTTSTSAQP